MNTVPKKPMQLTVGDIIALDPHEAPDAVVVAWAVIAEPTVMQMGRGQGQVMVVYTDSPTGEGLPDFMILDPDAEVHVQPAEVAERAGKLAGLRALLDFLDARPDLPLPYGIEQTVIDVRKDLGDTTARIAEVERLAELMGVTAERVWTGHRAERRFGPHVVYLVNAHGVYEPESEAS